jgi:hypothetical protein
MAIAGATAAGTFIALVIKRPGPLQMLSWFAVGQMSSFYLAVPLSLWLMIDMAYYRPLGLFFGAAGLLLWTAVLNFTQRLSEDPLGTVSGLWRTFRGHPTGGDSER